MSDNTTATPEQFRQWLDELWAERERVIARANSPVTKKFAARKFDRLFDEALKRKAGQ